MTSSMLIPVFSVCLSLPAFAAPQSDDFARAMDDGEKAIAHFHYQEAISFFEKAVQLDQRSANAHIGLANALMLNVLGGPVTDADIEALLRAKKEEQIALAFAPNSAEALAGLGELQFRIGLGKGAVVFKRSTGLAEAKDTLARALAADTNNYHANYQLARIAGAELLWINLQVRAAAGLKPGVKQDLPPAAAAMWRRQTEPILRKGIEHAKAAVAAKTNAYDAMHELSGLYLVRSLIEENSMEKETDLKLQEEWQAKSQLAYARYQRALTDTSQPGVELHSFQDAMVTGRKAAAVYRYESAVHAFEKAVQFNDKSADAHIELANALIRSAAGDGSTYPFDPDRLQRAAQEDRKALDLAHDNADAMAGIATATYLLNRAPHGSSKADAYAEARAWTKKALATDQTNFRANYLMTTLAEQEAGSALFDAQSEAYKKSPDHKVPPDVLEALRRSYAEVVDEGLRYGQAALTARPGSYLAIYKLSSLYSIRNQFIGNASKADSELSAKLFQQALQLVPKDDPEGEKLRQSSVMRIFAGIPGSIPPAPPTPKK